MVETTIKLKDICPVCGKKLEHFEYCVKDRHMTFLKIDCDWCRTRFAYKPVVIDSFSGDDVYEYDPADMWNGGMGVFSHETC